MKQLINYVLSSNGNEFERGEIEAVGESVYEMTEYVVERLTPHFGHRLDLILYMSPMNGHSQPRTMKKATIPSDSLPNEFMRISSALKNEVVWFWWCVYRQKVCACALKSLHIGKMNVIFKQVSKLRDDQLMELWMTGENDLAMNRFQPMIVEE